MKGMKTRMKKRDLLLVTVIALLTVIGCSNDNVESRQEPEQGTELVIERNPRIEEIVQYYTETFAGLAANMPDFTEIRITAGDGYEIVLIYVLSDEFINTVSGGDLDIVIEVLEGDTIDQAENLKTFANIFMRDYDLELLTMTISYETEDGIELARNSLDFEGLEPDVELVGIGLTTDEILSLIDSIEIFENLQIFELENMIVHTLINEDENIRMFTYYLNNDEYATAVVFRLDSNARNQVVSTANSIITELIAHLNETLPNHQYAPLIRGNETFGEYRVFLVASTSEIEIEDLPWSVDEVGQFEATSILDDSDFQRQIVEHALALDFNSIIDLVEEYLSENEVTEDDIAHEILTMSQRGTELLENVYLYIDDFNGDITVYYNDVRDITQDINIVPFIRPGNIGSTGRGNAGLYITMGFYRGDWLFFERTELRRADGSFWESNHNSWDTVRDVIGGGMIREAVTTNWTFAHLGSSTNWLYQKMDSDYDHVLRFRNRRDDQNYDRSLSTTEVSAIMTIGELFQIMGYLADELPRNR